MLKSPVDLKKGDNLFEKSAMTFGEHLEELRRCLMWAFASLAIGMTLGFPFADPIISYIQSPLETALENFNQEKWKKEYLASTGRQVPVDYATWMKNNKRVRQVLYFDRHEILDVVQQKSFKPIAADVVDSDLSVSANVKTEAELSSDAAVESVANETEPEANEAMSVDRMVPLSVMVPFETTTEALGLQEPFMVWMKAVFGIGFVLASPGIFYSVWHFVAAGLYPQERRYVYFFLPVSVLLFMAGACLAFFFVFQFVLGFLLTFNDSLHINASPRLTDYMSFVLILTIGFGLSFQLPLVMLILERIGITSTKLYITQWRTAILIIAFISMVLTPAEVMSMIGMGVPLIFLYFLGIGMCLWLPRSGSPHVGYDPR